jgi:ribosomal protein S18 acetylase RimI-like enzyme
MIASIPNNDSSPLVLQADLDSPPHQAAILAMLEAYSADPMGDAQPLSASSRVNVIAGLRAHPTTIVFLAFRGEEPVGMAICFRGFSTFAAKPLINVHDFYVVPELRGLGVSRMLMTAVERKACEIGCCKLTLEVQENNLRAQRFYETYGYVRGEYADGAGKSLFFWKLL